MFSVENPIEKERKKLKNVFKTNVSSQNHRYKKRRGRHRSGVTYLLRGETVRAGLVRAEWAAILHGDLWESPIKYHKCPTFDTKRNAGDFQTFSNWLALQFRWTKHVKQTKMQMSLRKQTNKHKNVNM